MEQLLLGWGLVLVLILRWLLLELRQVKLVELLWEHELWLWQLLVRLRRWWW